MRVLFNMLCYFLYYTLIMPINFGVILQLVKLLESKEVNHVEFCRIKNVVDEILLMDKSTELSTILHILLEPTWVATGLKVEYDRLVSLLKQV